MSDKPQVLGYGRASTKKQVESPETQKDTMKRYAEFNRMEELGPPTFFIDAAKSGKIAWEERPAGAALFKTLRRGDHVIISKLDRAFRRLSDCVLVLDRFERMGVKLHICNLMGGAIDLSSPMGRFMIHILAAFAELERSFISERTKDGMANCKRKGTARSRFPGYGFKWEKRWVDGKLAKVPVADPAEREVMGSIVEWRMRGNLSWDEIRDHLRTLKITTREGKEWDANRIRRTFKAELKLQLGEQRASQ